MNSKLKKNKFNIILLLIILLGIILAISVGYSKQRFHIDEISTFLLSNGYYNPNPYAVDMWIDKNYYLDFLMTYDDTRFSLGSVFYNQTQDVHPPLYYIFINVLSTLLPGVFSKWIGLSLNLFSYIGTILLVVYLTKKITNRSTTSLLAGMFWAFSIAAMSTYNFIRMYMLLALIQLILVVFVDKYLKEETQYSRLYLTGVFVTIILGGLTQYFFYVFAGLLILYTILLIWSQKKFFKGLILGLVSLLGVYGDFKIFPATYDHIFNSYRGDQVMENSNAGINFSSMSSYLVVIKDQLLGGQAIILVLFIVTAILGISIIIFRRFYRCGKLNIKFSWPSWAVVFVATISYIFAVSQITPILNERYIYSVYPLLAVLIISLLHRVLLAFDLKNKWQSIILFIFILASVSLGLLTQPISYIYPEAEKSYDIIEDYNDHKVLLLSKDYFKLKEPILELMAYDEVYPHRYKSNEGLPEDEVLKKENELIVYVDSELATNQLLQSVKDKYDFSEFQLLYELGYYKIYIFN